MGKSTGRDGMALAIYMTTACLAQSVQLPDNLSLPLGHSYRGHVAFEREAGVMASPKWASKATCVSKNIWTYQG
jgi:hypothetical protein